MQNRKINSFLFDLDGTLVDSLYDIADAMNAVLEEWNCPVHPRESYRTFVGDGMEMLAWRVLPEELQSPEQIHGCVTAMKKSYASRWRETSAPYPGIRDLLTACTREGYRLGVLSNKPEEFTREMVAAFFPDVPFDPVRGAREGVPVKPDPTSARSICSGWQVPPESVAYVGDTNTDIQTGLGAGFVTFGVTWGFRDRRELEEAGASYVVDHPRDLLRMVQEI